MSNVSTATNFFRLQRQVRKQVCGAMIRQRWQARQQARALAGKHTPVVQVGNSSSPRQVGDFTTLVKAERPLNPRTSGTEFASQMG